MRLPKINRAALASWLALSALVLLCGVLGVLQYRWIGEVSVAEGERMRASLQANLQRLSRDFNSELTAVCMALLPPPGPGEPEPADKESAGRFMRWKQTSRHASLIRKLGLAEVADGALSLRLLDPASGAFADADWPAEWLAVKRRTEALLAGEPLGRPRGPRGMSEGLLIEVPRLMRPPPREGGPAPGGRRSFEWLLLEVDLAYARDVLLPELLHRHLGESGSMDYQVQVVTNTEPAEVIYPPGAPGGARMAGRFDAAVNLFEIDFERLFRRGGPPGGRGPGPETGPPRNRAQSGEWGRWRLSVRHREGSLDAVVARARWRNLAVTGGILLLMLVTVGVLIRLTRQTQRLAQLQMDFVAGVSHELRTPLTVIRTAAYNLRGPLAANPSRVERYGELIQQESERLTNLVEQVLQFARAKGGRAIREPEPVSLETVIDESLEASRAVAGSDRCVIEKSVEPGLPLVMGDRMALKHAILNLISNAIKYGTEGSNWIGVSALQTRQGQQAVIEVRVADRGPGIPADEQKSIFDPFYRGRRALQDQIHGSGLGLSLVKSIVEAHGGAIAVFSQPAKGTEFVVRIPVAPPEQQDEFADSTGRG